MISKLVLLYTVVLERDSTVILNCVLFFQQDESTQRYQEGLKHIREKAFEMSVLRHSTEDHNEAPQITPYDNKKMCTICNAIVSFKEIMHYL